MFEPPTAAAPMLPLVETAIRRPPGLLGDLADFILNAAPRPVHEIALAGAIGFLAGVAGRAFNVSGTGLNHYVLCLAPTGTGKEAINGGISKLIATLIDPTTEYACVPSAASFYGPADMASGQGLLRTIAKRSPPCFVSVIGEFGLRFKQMADARAHSADTSLLRVLLDLYNKSGHGQIVGETVYSDRDKNTGVILAPAVSLIGESTPHTFYGYLNEAMVANGLVPRFTIIEYQGPRPRLNRQHANARPDRAMIDRIAALMAYCNTANATNSAKAVQFMPDAETLLNDFNDYCDDQINGTDHSATREIWTRAHVKALKLAALIAVGESHEAPFVNLDAAQWAQDQVVRDSKRLLQRFESGEFGEVAGNEATQQSEVLRCIDEYLDPKGSFDRFAKYGVTADMYRDRVFTESYLSRRVGRLAAFKDDRMGPTKALKRTIQNLMDADEIRQFPSKQMRDLYGVSPRAFARTPTPQPPHLRFFS